MKKSLTIALAVGISAATAGAIGVTSADAGAQVAIQDVPQANPRFGIPSNQLTASASMVPVAWGLLPLQNADTANGVTRYGYNTAKGGPLTQDPNEAYKTEPDKNVYLVMNGHHYLFQGHETGPRGYITRINLDESDPAKRVTLMTDKDGSGNAFPTIDGITWDPFSKQLLFTSEGTAPTGGVWALKLDSNGDPVDGVARRLPGLGSAGYEGIQNDSAGNIYLVEDTGGAGVDGGKVPNSYVYRFKPTNKSNLFEGGTLQALQIKRVGGAPATADQLRSNPRDQIVSQLHTYGTALNTSWVDIHTGKSGVDANAAATKNNATPLKRPENGVFRPGTNFRDFYFTETGDTSTSSTLPGAYGAVYKLHQDSLTSDSGRISPVWVGDVQHAGFDNITFLTDNQLLVVEDAGDTLHGQRNALDSGYAVDLTTAWRDGKAVKPQVKRFLAEGRDASAYYDATSNPGYNDGDNEITGIHVSDGDPSVGGILGAKSPQPLSGTWRTFWTQQHGDNTTFEIFWSSLRRNTGITN